MEPTGSWAFSLDYKTVHYFHGPSRKQASSEEKVEDLNSTRRLRKSRFFSSFLVHFTAYTDNLRPLL